jgi:uncharacterized protein YndB with AHSA1/START domain
MTTTVDASVLVNRPVSIVYNQWTQFEEFPVFMGGVQEVRQIDDRTLHWVAEIAGVKRQWQATIVEQRPDRRIAWAATEGATNAGAVEFEPAGSEQTMVRLHLQFEPEGLLDKAGDALNLIERRAEDDLERFKAFIESEEYATGAWRGTINPGLGAGTPGVAAAEQSRGDKGAAGVSGKAVAAGAAIAAGAAGAAAAKAAAGRVQDARAKAAAEPEPQVSGAEHTHDDWIGRDVVDRDGDRVGSITDVFYDDVTGQPEWLTVSTGWFGTNESFVPIAGTTMVGDDIRVGYDTELIKQAPTRGRDSHLEEAEEARLYAHYGFDVGGTDYRSRFGDRSRADEGFRYYDQRHRDRSTEAEQEAMAVRRARLRRYSAPAYRTDDDPEAQIRRVGRLDT